MKKLKCILGFDDWKGWAVYYGVGAKSALKCKTCGKEILCEDKWNYGWEPIFKFLKFVLLWISFFIPLFFVNYAICFFLKNIFSN